MFPLKRLSYSSRNSILRHVSSNAVFAYWYQERNFGDLLTPELLRGFGLKPLLALDFNKCEIVSVGSILEIVPETFCGAILGTGFLLSETEKKFPNSNILSVRGRLTAEKLGLPESTRYGDPGLLVDSIYDREIAGIPKRHALGIVPHYRDKNAPMLGALLRNNPDSLIVIDVCRTPIEVIKEIAACEHILSSSLHGLVVAHSLQIAASPIRLLEKLRGGDFKFMDYYSAFGMEPKFQLISGDECTRELCGLATSVDSARLRSVKHGIQSAFREFAGRFL